MNCEPVAPLISIPPQSVATGLVDPESPFESPPFASSEYEVKIIGAVEVPLAIIFPFPDKVSVLAPDVNLITAPGSIVRLSST